jgi:hypothetical protein
VERRDDHRGKGVEVVDGEVRLAARLAGADRSEWRHRVVAVAEAEDRLAQLAARRAQAHALAQAQEQAGDLSVAEHEGAASLDALVASVHVLAR